MLESVYRVIEDNQEMYLAWLQELCRQPSVAAQNRGMQETARLVEHFLGYGGEGRGGGDPGLPGRVR
jgi:hypothetical protein